MSNYWAEREAKALSKLTTKSIKETDAQLRRYYKDAMLRVFDDFEAVLDKIYSSLAADKEPTPADLYRLDKYWKAQAQLREELQKLGDKTAKRLSQDFTKQYQHIYSSIALDSGVFDDIDTETAQQIINQVWCADGKSWSQRVWDNTNKLQEMLNENLTHCVTTGKKTSELKKMLRDTFGASYRQANTLVNTEMAHIQTQAARDRYVKYGIQEVEMLVDADERTCPICAKLEGKRFPIGGQMPVPAHPNCRCCIIPVVED